MEAIQIAVRIFARYILCVMRMLTLQDLPEDQPDCMLVQKLRAGTYGKIPVEIINASLGFNSTY